VKDKSLLVGVPLAVLVSAAIAYAVVFWTPWFKRTTGWYDVGGYVDLYPDQYGNVVPNVTDLKNLQPVEFQELVQNLFDDLLRLSEAQLYVLSGAGDDVCRSSLLDCRGVPGINVRPFVDKALAHKQAREAIAISAGSLDTAKLSLAVAFAAFLVSVFGMFVKRKA
jgi:hypothetical protein